MSSPHERGIMRGLIMIETETVVTSYLLDLLNADLPDASRQLVEQKLRDRGVDIPVPWLE